MPGFTCSECNQLISQTTKGLIWHLKNEHVLVNGWMFTRSVKCGQDGCLRTFRYPKALGRHIESEHVLVRNGEFNENMEEDGEDQLPALDPQVHVDQEEFSLDVTNSAALFLAKMKASSSAVQSTVDHVVAGSTELFSNIISRLKFKTEQYLTSQNIDPDDPERENLMAIFDQCENPFENLETAYQQQKYFESSGYFVTPREIPVGVAYHPRYNRDTGHVEQVAKQVTFQYIPLRDLLKCILESKGFMNAITEHHPSQDGVMRDFHDGDFCKEHEFFSKENTIKLLPFVDDCEVANPLGSKAGLHKITMVYFIILNLPPKFRSSLNNCFLLSLFNAGDVKTYGYAPFLQPLVDDIKFLEQEGLSITTNDFEGTVYAGIAQVTGDNLGVNGILGFVESFVSNHYCRHCNMHRNEMQGSSTACQEQLRTVHEYEEDLELNNYTETGIKSYCIFNEVENFHVTTNYAPDIMHDLLEGVCGLEVYLVLAQLIREDLFDLDLLNSRITSFDYSATDSKNKPSPISNNRLQQPDGASGQTASQMWCLVRNLPLLIGDKVPEGHPFFELLLLLIECMDFIFCPEITTEETYFVKHLIKEHHEYFLEIFPDRTLKPKHHFMTHYPHQMRLLGPLINFWTIRFEAKHRFFKRLGHIVCNFRNILKTLCFRQQMFLCYNIMSGRDLAEIDLEVGPGSQEMVESLDGADLIVRALGVHMFDMVYVAKWCVLHGIKYSKNLLVITGKSDDMLPVFQQILYVIVCENNGVHLLTQGWKTIEYHRHTHSYAIEQPNNPLYSFISVNDLYDYFPCHASESYNEEDLQSHVAPASPEHLDQPIENEPKRPLAVDQALSESASTQNVQPTKKSRMNFNVRSILEESEIGVQVISELDTDILSRKSRIKMVQILVAYIINRFGERPHADVKIQMAKSVVEEFPFLKDEEGQGYEAWYTSGKGIHSATGWLEERLRNVRRKSVKHRPTEKDLNTASTSLTHLTTSLPDPVLNESDHNGMKEWMKANLEPLSTLKNYMEKTVLNRAEWIRKTPDLPMREVMKEYPRLFDTPGMVEIDFRTLYADVAENLFLRLTPPIVEKIISYADTQAEKWTTYLHMIPRNLKSDEERKNAAIGLLPCVFPTGRKNRKRCTIDEALSAFIDCQPVGTNMPKYLEEAPRCPFVLAIGNRYNPTQVFVIIEGQGLEQPNLTKAIDVCFKVFYILDINYPWQCSSSWEFIQKVLYGIEDKVKGKTTPAVVAMRAALK